MHPCVGNEHVQHGEDGADHHVGRQDDRCAGKALQHRQPRHDPQRLAVERGVRQADEAAQQQRSDDHQSQVFGHAASKAARMVHTPQEVEAVLDLLDRAEQSPGEQREADGPDHAAAHAVRELHDPRSQLLRGIAPDGTEELKDHRLQIAVSAEYLQDGEAEREQRDQRQQGGVDQAHGAQVDCAAPQVAHDRVGIAQHAHGQGEYAWTGGGRSEKAPVEKVPDARPHGHKIT